MQFNPELLLKSEESGRLLDEIRERLAQASYYLAPVTVLGLYVEDFTTVRLSDSEKARLRDRTRMIVERSIRREKAEQRKVTDIVIFIEPFYFIVLYNANRQSYLIPLGRIVESLRHEAFATIGVAGAPDYKRNIVIGGSTWLPSSGAILPEALFGRTVEAMMMAFASPQPDSYDRLQISKSHNDSVKLHEYGWDEGFVLSGPGVIAKARVAAEKAERAAADQAEAVATRPARTSGTSQKPPVVSGEGIRIYVPKRWWEFWKR